MRPLSFILATLALLPLLVFARPACTQTDAKDFANGFLTALNSKNKETLLDYVKKHFVPDPPAEQRVTRLLALVDEYGPFKFVKIAAQTPTQISVIVQDRANEHVGLKIVLTEGSPAKIQGIMLVGPDEMNAPPPKDYTGWTSLSTLIEQIRADTDNPAMAIAVLHDGKIEQAVAGTRVAGGNDKVTLDEPWSIGSIGKPVCSTVIARLIEMGKLDWSSTLGDLFKDVPMKDGYKGVTVEQIMHHRGGIPQHLGFRRPDVERIVQKETDPMKIRANFAREILNSEMIGKPGEWFAYSNGGYALLSVIAERLLEKPYEQIVEELVFQPLGLKHSFAGSTKLPEARPRGHVRDGQKLRQMDMAGPLEILVAGAGGGMNMSVKDMLTFGQAHLIGLQGKDGYLKASTVVRLHTGEPEAAMGGVRYGSGWGIETIGGLLMHTHNGSNGTMRAQLSIFPKLNLVVASFANSGGESEPSPPLQAVMAVAKKYAK